ncbi:hypothetical protein FB451DRAFT_1168945 [Mycena latifolia]|nr:hypothetical protein FB451DRAFT_1168945 [Mycena latifolia]
MFSKLLAFGLCALSLVVAAPSQQVSISCAVEQSGPATLEHGAHLGPGIAPGVYRISTKAGVLQAGNPFPEVWRLARTPDSHDEWRVERVSSDSNKYRIVATHNNLVIAYGRYSDLLQPILASGNEPWAATEFILDDKAGSNAVVIKVPGRNLYLTVPDSQYISVPVHSPVTLTYANGGGEQRWSFERLRD